MPPLHKAIQTVHNGVLYRSKTEAAWALFFDTLGVPFEYEPEGYELPSGRYLPDFLLMLAGGRRKVWFEIKGEDDTRYHHDIGGSNLGQGFPEALELGELTQRDTFIAYSKPGTESRGMTQIYQSWPCWDNNYNFTTCHVCGVVDIVFENRCSRIHCDCIGKELNRYAGRRNDDARVVRAIEAVRTHRFWNPKQ